MTDRVPTVDEIAYDEYLKFAHSHRQHLADHPVFQKCGENPSSSITRWGTILAACKDCLQKELREFNDSCAAVEAAREEDF